MNKTTDKLSYRKNNNCSECKLTQSQNGQAYQIELIEGHKYSFTDLQNDFFLIVALELIYEAQFDTILKFKILSNPDSSFKFGEFLKLEPKQLQRIIINNNIRLSKYEPPITNVKEFFNG